MKAYIQSYQNVVPHNYNFMNAWQGFKEMGFEIIPFSDAKTLKTSEGNDIIVGYVNTVRSRLFDFGITAPEMDYPKKLEKYLGRRIWQTTMKNVSNNPTCWPVFVKPLEDK